MEWVIKMHRPERTEYDGVVIPEKTEEYTIPFESQQQVYYTHKKKWWKKNSPWVITKTRVIGMWATNTYGVTLHNDYHLDVSEFKYLFTDREEAIEFCLKKNAHAKVKIYEE
jgi:hypothetical protein